ncbi:MAG: murein biosynthesis integral membrane protein MurJ [Mycobacteriales bacterium]
MTPVDHVKLGTVATDSKPRPDPTVGDDEMPEVAAQRTDVHSPEELASAATQAARATSWSSGIARHSSVMALGSLVSRVTGFARTAILGAVLGAFAVGDSYQVANTLPNMVYELLIGGVLASVVVPLLVGARRDADGGEAYIQRLLTLAVLLLAAATIIAVLAAPLITSLVATKTEDRHLVTLLAYLLIPELFFYGIAALFGAVLNTRGHFAAPTWAPILNNLSIIVTAGIFVALPGPALPTPSTITTDQLLVLGLGTTFGVALQAAALWPALRRVGFRWRWRFDFGNSSFTEAGRLAGWMLCYVGVSQVSVFVVMALAYRAGQAGGPGPAVYEAASLMFMMAHGIIAVSIITALLPRMSAAAAENKTKDVAHQLSFGIRLSSVILMPATAAYMALGVPLAIAAFQWGNFSSDRAQSTGLAIVAVALGLVPFAVSQLQTFAFYAMRDTKTPALINIPVVVIRLFVDIVLFLSLPAHYVVIGLMIGNAVSYAVAAALLTLAMRRRLGSLHFGRIFQTLARLLLASVIAGLIGWGLAFSCTELLGGGKLGGVMALGIGGSALVISFVAASVFLRVQEVSQFVQTVTRKFALRRGL